MPKNTVHVVLKVFESERLSNMPTVFFIFLSLVLVATIETRGDIFIHSVYVFTGTFTTISCSQEPQYTV